MGDVTFIWNNYISCRKTTEIQLFILINPICAMWMATTD